MIVDVSIKLRDFSGDVLVDNDGKGNATEATLKTAIVNALLSPEQKENGVDKVTNYELAKKVFNNDSVKLNSEEIVRIKEKMGKFFTPIVVGQCFNILDGFKE